MLHLFELFLFPLFQGYTCKLAKLSACIARSMATIKKIYIFLHCIAECTKILSCTKLLRMFPFTYMYMQRVYMYGQHIVFVLK